MGYKQLRRSNNNQLFDMVNTATKVTHDVRLAEGIKLVIRRVSTNLVGVDVVTNNSGKSGLYLMVDDSI